MGKIIVFEHTNILGYKMKKILMENGFQNVDIVNEFNAKDMNLNQLWQNPDCIIVDLDNRNQDMVQLIKKVKKEKETEKIPIISISGDADLRNLKRAIAIGSNDFILKPFETETLIRKVFKVYYSDKVSTEGTKNYKTGEIFKKNAITIKWNNELAIGVEQIDTEHRQIIENFNKLYSLMKDGLGHEYYHELIEFLTVYVNVHFEHEEQIQLSISNNEYQEHKVLHDKFRLQVNKLKEKHREQTITNNDLISFCLFIKDWLLHHILLEDMKIKAYMPE